jgi:UDP-glucuronate 4-epimerase
MTILITGAAGFIGAQLCKQLLERGESVVGIDNLNNYYDVNLKKARLARLAKYFNFLFIPLDLIDRTSLTALFTREKFRRVVNLAAQAGVRYSIDNPYAYVDSNLVGFVNLLENCRHHPVEHLVFASSSSVYGLNTKMPFSVHDNVDHPISLYAATKKANELMAHTYAHLYGLPVTGLRFFTVYGPWGRPDMAYFKFTQAILNDQPIEVYNYGQMRRDFTYIDDIIEGVIRVLNHVPKPNKTWSGDSPDPSSSPAPYQLYNIGNNQPVELMYYIETLEKALGKKAQFKLLPMQPGDVPATYADISELTKTFDFRPQTSIEVGIDRFVKWYKDYYKTVS